MSDARVIEPIGIVHVVAGDYAIDPWPRVDLCDGFYEAFYMGRRADHEPRPRARFFSGRGATAAAAVAAADAARAAALAGGRAGVVREAA